MADDPKGEDNREQYHQYPEDHADRERRTSPGLLLLQSLHPRVLTWIENLPFAVVNQRQVGSATTANLIAWYVHGAATEALKVGALGFPGCRGKGNHALILR